jgi:hypothetical protein
MKSYTMVDLNESLPEARECLSAFISINSFENRFSFVEFRANLHVVMVSLIKLLLEIRLKKSSIVCKKLQVWIIKSLIDCSLREEAYIGQLPRWEQIVQEEKFRQDIIHILGDLSEKLKTATI